MLPVLAAVHTWPNFCPHRQAETPLSQRRCCCATNLQGSQKVAPLRRQRTQWCARRRRKPFVRWKVLNPSTQQRRWCYGVHVCHFPLPPSNYRYASHCHPHFSFNNAHAACVWAIATLTSLPFGKWVAPPVLSGCVSSIMFANAFRQAARLLPAGTPSTLYASSTVLGSCSRSSSSSASFSSSSSSSRCQSQDHARRRFPC